KRRGWKVAGIEPDSKARKIAEESIDKKIEKDLDKIIKTGDKYDIITMWHVLEHIHDINEVFIKLKGLLKERGKMIIAVPNIDSLDHKIYQNDWAAFDVPRHLYHFNKETMKTFILKHGMKIKKVYPMKFDSYYISMLSEKYKNGNSNIIKSIVNGYKSNSYATKNENNYSSLIFEVKK
ncbi:MAG: class I SAM-dependent methyltransferase, partial [Nitrososphaeraceae archaeon]|nr:class I SAM-dependent methyltransferase [Nitrososphaeraceae archaeon]